MLLIHRVLYSRGSVTVLLSLKSEREFLQQINIKTTKNVFLHVHVSYGSGANLCGTPANRGGLQVIRSFRANRKLWNVLQQYHAKMGGVPYLPNADIRYIGRGLMVR